MKAAETQNEGGQASATDGPLLLDTDGAARLLSISPRTLQTWVRQKRVPFVKIGSLTRFRPAALQEWIQSQETTPAPEVRS